FLNAKQALVDAGELSPRSWSDYKEACDMLVSHLGKRRLVSDLDPSDFASLRSKTAKRWGPARLGGFVGRVRSVLKYAFAAGLTARPVRTGPGFAPPSRKVLRLHRAKQGPRLFGADEIRRMLDAAGPQLRAMILLGVNCGFGNADVGRLPLAAL